MSGIFVVVLRFVVSVMVLGQQMGIGCLIQRFFVSKQGQLILELVTPRSRRID